MNRKLKREPLSRVHFLWIIPLAIIITIMLIISGIIGLIIWKTGLLDKCTAYKENGNFIQSCSEGYICVNKFFDSFTNLDLNDYEISTKEKPIQGRCNTQLIIYLNVTITQETNVELPQLEVKLS